MFRTLSYFYSHIKTNKNNDEFTFCNLSKLVFVRKLLFYKPNQADRDFIKEIREYVPPKINFSINKKRISNVSVNLHDNDKPLYDLIKCTNRYNSINYACYVAIPTKYMTKIERIEDEYWTYSYCLF